MRDLLDAALGIVTNAPIVEVQKKVELLRHNIREIEDLNVKLKEKQLVAPKDATLPGILTDTIASIEAAIAENNKKIEANRAEIKAQKAEIAAALKASGVELAPDQLDLLLDSVLSGDLVRLVAVFNAAKMIDGQLAKLISTTGDNMEAARRYFAMHAALFAMLVQAQDATIAKIDTQYLPKLEAIIAGHRSRTRTHGGPHEGRQPARSEARARIKSRQPEACRRRGARLTGATCSSSASRSRRRASRPSTT